MARQLILKNLMKLAQGIGANPSKFMGTKSNITFLGTGPQKNPLFQRPLAGIDNASMKQLGPGMIPAVEDATGFASAGKLNDIQLKILTENLTGINKILNPPKLPSAKIMTLPQRGEGIKSLEGVDPRDTILPMQRSTFKSALPEPGPGELAAFKESMNMQTGMSRAIAREILTKDTRLNLKPQELYSLKVEGGKGPDPLDLMKKYYGESMLKYDDFLNQVDITAAAPAEFAEMILKNVKLVPQFAEGGLADVMQMNNTISRYDLL